MKDHRDTGKYISILYRQFQMYCEREMSPYNISGSEYMFIVTIPDQGSINQRQLCNQVVVTEAMGTRVVKRLVDKGFVKREKDQDDRRQYAISLTHKGREIKPVIREKLMNWSNLLNQGLEEDQVDTAYNSLKHFSENALLEITGGQK